MEDDYIQEINREKILKMQVEGNEIIIRPTAEGQKRMKMR